LLRVWVGEYGLELAFPARAAKEPEKKGERVRVWRSTRRTM
jgi:hypothetical protein